MIDLNAFQELLVKSKVEFITGVPDTLLNDFCLHLENNWSKDKHVIAANEGNSIALAAGYYLATGTTPIVYMQNSGIGNALNPLISLTHPSIYGIPMILMIGWRGEPGVNDHSQHTKQGILTPVFMDDVDIPWKRLSDSFFEVECAFRWALQTAKETGGPVALLVPKGVMEKGEKSSFSDDEHLMSREEAIKMIVEKFPKDTVFIGSTGRITRELYEIRNLRGDSHENDFLNVGAMGHTSSIATGLAIALENRNVVCLDGDSSAIMHLGSLAVNGTRAIPNYTHIVLNNGAHESVGGQESVGLKINFTGIAANIGFATAEESIYFPHEFDKAFELINASEKPKFFEIKIKKGMRSDMPVLKFSLMETKKLLMYNLLGE